MLRICLLILALELSACSLNQETGPASLDSAASPATPVTTQPATDTSAGRSESERIRMGGEASFPLVKKQAEITPSPVYHPAERKALLSRMAPGIVGMPMPPQEPVDRENYAAFETQGIFQVAVQPVSTFSIDVDTGSYSNVRRFLNQGRLPNQNAVRVEEMINYFDYHYPPNRDASRPFSIHTELAPAPWNARHVLLQVGLKGYQPDTPRPSANLVFLLDVSGSMRSPAKLPLLKSGLKLLVNQLKASDHIAIVVYAGATGVVLESTPGDQKAKIMAALDQLYAGGSTNGGAGIRLAYNIAAQHFIKGGINRILLATDGDFNVGTTNFDALKQLVETRREQSVSLTALGFGSGNYNDKLMEQLADAGNGNYSYIDTLNEARKVLVEEMDATLNTIAKDVKIQIEFNPAVVAEYRLIGYENRMLKREDFNNDKVDAGEIGAGHTVTALYELALAGSKDLALEPLRYQPQAKTGRAKTGAADSGELGFLRLRYKQPDGDTSRLIEQKILHSDIQPTFAKASTDFRFAASVAGFGQLLRGGKYLKDYAYNDILRQARAARGDDNNGYRGEFIQLVKLAASLAPKP